MSYKRFLLVTSILYLLLLFHVAKAELTEDHLKYMLSNQSELDMLKDQINNASESFPSSLKKAILGSDRTYYVKIGDSDIGMSVQDGKIVGMSVGAPEFPTHIINTDYQTILEFANSGNLPLTAAKLLAEKKIEIDTAESYNGGSNNENILESISSNWEIVVVVAFILVVALIVLFIFKFKGKGVKDETFKTDNKKKSGDVAKPPEIQKESEKIVETKPSETTVVPEEQKNPVDQLIDEFEKSKDENR